MNLREALQQATRRLAQAEVDAPGLSARLLAGKVLGLTSVQVLTEHLREMRAAELAAFEELVGRRERGEPAAYLLGEREFYGLSFRVTPDVLIPRPETELIVDEVRERFAVEAPLRFVDLGTGSGILAVTLAYEFPKAQGVAVDLSPAALRVARENAQRHDVSDRLDFVLADFMQPLPVAEVDVIVSNPPYVTWKEYSELSREVADFEPRAALVSGKEFGDGLDHVRGLIPHAVKALRPGGVLLIEIGWQQGVAGSKILRESSLRLEEVRVLQDLAGNDRVLVARKHASVW